MNAGDGYLRIWEPRTDRLHAALMVLGGEQPTTFIFNGGGHYRAIGDLAEEIVYVVLTDQGEQLTLTADEFAQRYGWKNDPSQVKLPDASTSTTPATSDAPAKPTAPAEAKPAAEPKLEGTAPK